MVELMLTEYSRLHDDNQHLSEELKSSNELICNNYDAIATIQIECEALRKDNQKLREGKDEPKTKNAISNVENGIDLERQLAEKNNKIEEREPISGESRKNMPNRSNDSNHPYPMDKMRLRKITTDIETLFNEKQYELTDKQAQINELIQQLDNDSHTEIDKETETKINVKLNEMKENDQILVQQLALYEEQNELLMNELEKYVQFNDNLLKSISICQGELGKFNGK